MKPALIVTIIVGLVGCAAPAPQATSEPSVTRPFEWRKVLNAVWDAVDKNEQVWIDGIQLAEGELLGRKLKSLDPNATIIGSKYGVFLRCHVADTDVVGMTAFRKELKRHPIISRYFPIVNFSASWQAVQKGITEKQSLEFEVYLVNTGQS